MSINSVDRNAKELIHPKISIDAVNWQNCWETTANETDKSKAVCRNSVQGQLLVADERGAIKIYGSFLRSFFLLSYFIFIYV